MAEQFKRGDIVRCVDNDNSGYGLTYGRLYEVAEATPNSSVRLAGDDGAFAGVFWRDWRFELTLAAPRPQQGDPGDENDRPLPYCAGREAAEFVALCDTAQGPLGDAVYRPNHYARYKVEPIYFLGENRVDFLVGNVIKYLLRFDAKNGAEDLAKAKRYLEMLTKREAGDPKWAE